MSDRDALNLRSDVAIEPVTVDHAPNMYRWMCDPVIRGNIGLRSEPSLERTITWITNAREDTSVRPFAIMFEHQHVGNVILDRIDRHLAMARLSVYIGESTVRASGIGLTAIYLVLTEGFQTMDFHKVWLTVHTRNFRAIRTYTKLGFALEGILRDEFCLDGQRVAALYMGLLGHDFRRLSAEFRQERVAQ